MSWFGNWNLEYTGENSEKFVNTAKLVINNLKNRFEISDNKNELESIRELSWYSADMEIEKILSYLDDGDQINVLIDGETHPVREILSEGEYDFCEFEEQTYKKENGKVTMECEYTDCNRCQSDRYGVKDDFIYELAYPEQAKKENLERGYITTLDTYIEWITQEMGDKEEMLPIIQDFMNEIMNISRDEVVEEYGKINEEAFRHFNEVKDKLKSLESTKEYLSEIKEKLPPKEKEENAALPDLSTNMSTKEGKKQSFIEKKKAEKEVNKNIKQSVIDYFLGCVKHKYPNLTPENEKRFTKKLGESIDYKLEGWDCNFSIDYDPCQELLSAFYSMDMSNFDSGLPIYDVFPIKTCVKMEKGKCATVVSDYEKSGILYISDDYKQELLESVNTRIMQEESKIPQEVKDEFEQEYQTKMKALDIEREPLIKKQEEIQKVLDQKKELGLKTQQLIESYSTRISELETLGLSEEEKLQRKQTIIKEIKQTQEAAKSDKFRERLDEIREKYGWEDLKSFDEEYKDIFDKEQWIRSKNTQYARKEHDRIWEEYKKEHPKKFGCPDTSSVPSNLDKLYSQRDEIAEYDREQGQESENISEEQQKFVEALGKAYAEYMEKSGAVDEYGFRNNRKLILAEGFSKYFASNYQNLTNPAFLIDFENGPMREIAKKRGFEIEHSMFDWEDDWSRNIAHIKVSEGLIYSVDELLDQAKIEYATPEAIQQQINKLNSEILFMQDTGESTWNLRRIQNQRDSFVSYQRQLQGEKTAEPSLEELDEQKYTLEALDEKTTELLKHYEKTSQPGIETDGIEFVD